VTNLAHDLATRSASARTLADILGVLRHSTWLANDFELVTQDGAVSTIPNRGVTSVTPLTQSSPALRPTQTSGGVTSDGTDLLTAEIVPAIVGRPYMFVVARLSALTQPRYLFGLWTTLAASNNGGNVIALAINNGVWTFDRRDSGGYENGPAGFADTKLHVFELGFTAGGVGTCVVDGAARDSVMTAVPNANCNGLVIHDVHATPQGYASAMQWAHITVCASEPSESAKRAARGLLSAQYGVPPSPLAGVELFDTSTLESVFGVAQSFGGAVTDGSRIFFLPASSHNYLVAHDPAAGAFSDPLAWQRFNMSNVGANTGRQWGVFGGRYVYVAPYFGGSDLVRHDTLGAVESAASYEVKNLSAIDPLAYGFTGMTAYDHYVALIPSNNPLPALGVAVQYDQLAPYSANSSYKKFDCTTLHPRCKGFSLGVTCGDHTFFVPWDAGETVGDISGVLTWYDWTTDDFEHAAGWDFFDMTAVHAEAKGLSGGVQSSDGRYVWMVPVEQVRGGLNGTVFVQLDTQAPDWKIGAAYKTFDASTIAPNARGYYEAIYDGARYVYMICFYSGMNLRYDSWSADFSNVESWLLLDFAAYKNGVVGSRFGGGCAIDGNIYLPNSQYQWAARIPRAP
jgi:hypothetical protein